MTSITQSGNRLMQLSGVGQAVWLDFLERGFLRRGGLRELIARDGVSGLTSNPAIFEQAMGQGHAYDADFRHFARQGMPSATAAYEHAAIADIRAAADDLRPVYDRLARRDGYVSLEVSPYLAHDSAGTVAEARRLWRAVDRPNLMIKVPGTAAGVPAIRQLVEDGLNVNITLLFSQDAYHAVAEAFLAGLEARVARGEAIDHSASVASFFVSRIDARIDAGIDARVKQGDAASAALSRLRGKVAIANARLAYAWYEQLIADARWRALAASGALPQRLLWASTGTKDPGYPATLYVDALIGPDTVNTMPPRTLDAFREHGTVRLSLAENVADARQVLAEAERLGLDPGGVGAALVESGIAQFVVAFDALLAAVARKQAGLRARHAE